MTLINPYAAQNLPAVSNVPVFPIARLRRLGARSDQLEALGANWDAWGLDERRTFVDGLAVLSDPELSAVLHETPPADD